jgi:hypothetical protein
MEVTSQDIKEDREKDKQEDIGEQARKPPMEYSKHYSF